MDPTTSTNTNPLPRKSCPLPLPSPHMRNLPGSLSFKPSNNNNNNNNDKKQQQTQNKTFQLYLDQTECPGSYCLHEASTPGEYPILNLHCYTEVQTWPLSPALGTARETAKLKSLWLSRTAPKIDSYSAAFDADLT